MRLGGRAGSQGPLQYAGIPVPSTRTGIPPPGMHGRRLAATDSPEAAWHSWGRYANPGTAYSCTRVLRWLSPVLAILLAQSLAQDDKQGAGPSLRSGRQAGFTRPLVRDRHIRQPVEPPRARPDV